MKLADLLTVAATFLEADGAAHDINKAASLHKLRPAKGYDTASRQDIAALLRAEVVKQRIEPEVAFIDPPKGGWDLGVVHPGDVTIAMRADKVALLAGVSIPRPLRRPHLRPDGIPSRCDLLLHTPAELVIRKAVDEVEKLGADPKLTEAVNLLDMARERVADFVEGM
jgi:hypothetical protein